MLSLKGPKGHYGPPSKIALDIVKNVIASKGPLDPRRIWVHSQEVRPTLNEIRRGQLDAIQRAREAKTRIPEGAEQGLSDEGLKAKLTAHPVKTVACVIISLLLISVLITFTAISNSLSFPLLLNKQKLRTFGQRKSSVKTKLQRDF